MKPPEPRSGAGDAAERQGLMRGVLEQPDEDAPRLVLADWYEEHGEPDRAEFIRLQCRRPRLDDLHPETGNQEARRVLRARFGNRVLL
jgi:uncharacterized protein (TIGR02996 family)